MVKFYLNAVGQSDGWLETSSEQADKVRLVLFSEQSGELHTRLHTCLPLTEASAPERSFLVKAWGRGETL